MLPETKSFRNEQFGDVRTVIVDGEPWFCGKDILRALDYPENGGASRYFNAVPEQWKGGKPIATPGGEQNLACLSEQGLYFFLGRSDKPKAIPYQKWIAGEVIPSIIRNNIDQKEVTACATFGAKAFRSDKFGEVPWYESDGIVYLGLESCAIGLGFTDTSKGVEYVRWNTVRQYLTGFGFSQEVAKDTFIPENMFYRLAMKAKNATAEQFQAWIADEVIPSIRRTGVYMTTNVWEVIRNDPRAASKLLADYADEIDRRKAAEQKAAELQETVAVQNMQIAELNPKATYFNVVLACKDLLSITQIAKDYGWSARRMNQWLENQKIQYKQGRMWVLYQKYAEKGYTMSKTHIHTGNDGEQHASVHTYWTQAGRLFIYNRMVADGHLPTIEKEQEEIAS